MSGRIYVGQTKNFAKRKTGHLWSLRSSRHHNQYLQNSFLKHGECNFSWEFWDCPAEYLTEMEQWCIDQCRDNIYNLVLDVSDSTVFTDEARALLSAANKGRKMPEGHGRGGLLRMGDNNVSKRPEVQRLISQSLRRFTDEQCVAIYNRYIAGAKQVDLAAEYGCERMPIRSAINYVRRYNLGKKEIDLGIHQRRKRK